MEDEPPLSKMAVRKNKEKKKADRARERNKKRERRAANKKFRADLVLGVA